MDQLKRRREEELELAEDATLYGEFVSSFDAWVTPDQQRQIAEKLAHPGENPHRADVIGIGHIGDHDRGKHNGHPDDLE